jgi:hypothetical protein
MYIDVFTSNGTDAAQLTSKFSEWLGAQSTAPSFLALHQSVPSLSSQLGDLVDDACALHGATSCLGVMGADGPKIESGAGAFAIWDADGSYGTALAAISDDPRQAAREATQNALAAADRPGEAPELIWISSSPGQEEALLEGVQDIVGSNVPVLGGSAADDTVSGDWVVFDHGKALANGVIVSVLFPSRPISFAYHNGYAPTLHNGSVTAVEGRLLKEIDNRPAAEVYREWVGEGVIPENVASQTAILSESTLSPLGRYLESVSDVPYYLLAHPAGLTPNDELELFANVDVGDTLTLMTGSPAQLTQRAGKVASLAAQAGGFAPDNIAGALMIYCGGCMLAVQEQLDDVTAGVREALPGVPFLGVFTFGEQGVVLDGRNRHGNLMISAIVFGA